VKVGSPGEDADVDMVDATSPHAWEEAREANRKAA
jgi:hypothetical protein